jgi:hypothetical protein
MPSNSWEGLLAVLKAAGPAVTNTTTATSLLGTGASQDARFNLPSNFLNLGTSLTIDAAGVISTASSGPGTLTFSVQIGSSVVFAGPASGTLVASAASYPFTIHIDLTARAVGGGTNATIEGVGQLFSTALSTTTPVQILTPATSSGFDSTASGFVDLFATWSVASSSNSINLTNYRLMSCN